MNKVCDTPGRLSDIETVQGGPGTGLLLQSRSCGQGARSLKPSASEEVRFAADKESGGIGSWLVPGNRSLSLMSRAHSLGAHSFPACWPGGAAACPLRWGDGNAPGEQPPAPLRGRAEWKKGLVVAEGSHPSCAD